MQTIFHFIIHWKLTHDGFVLTLIDFVIFLINWVKGVQEISVLKKKSNIIKKETVRWTFVFLYKDNYYLKHPVKSTKLKPFAAMTIFSCLL